MDETFKISGEYIQLSKLLKASGISDSGGQAKKAIEEGLVTVDGVTETRKGRKLRDGMVVKHGDNTIRVVV
jgi:ribosome-associated protein